MKLFNPNFHFSNQSANGDGATLDFKRCRSGDLGMPLSAQWLPKGRNVRHGNGNSLKAFNIEVKFPMLGSEPEGARMVVFV